MASNFSSLTVTWFDETDGYSTSANIPTSDLINIDLFTDTGTGEVNEAEIEISAKGGEHVNTGDIIDKYDRFRIQCTDLGSNTYDRYFEVQEIVPKQDKGTGSTITCHCLGIEYHTQVIHYASQHFFKNAFFVAKDILDKYELNNGSRQPLINAQDSVYSTSTKIGNQMPKFTNNHYEFGLSEGTTYDYLMAMVDSLGGSVEQGGIGDFFELGFDTPAVNQIDLALFISGARSIDGNDTSNDASLTTIKNTTAINLSEQEGGIVNPTGTNVLAWGSPNHGSLPLGFSRYRGEELDFFFRPKWLSGIDYVENSKVIAPDGNHYKATSSHNGNTSGATDGTFAGDLGVSWWTQIDMSDEFGDSVQYSEWTDDKATLWLNGGTDPTALTSTPAWATSTSYTKYDLRTADDGTTAWATSTSYVINDEVVESSKKYRCLEDHTSGTFSTDLAAGKWLLITFRALEDHTSDGTAFSNDSDKWEEVDNASLGNGAGMWDGNMVIRDPGEDMFRTWVNQAVGDTDYDTLGDRSVNSNYAYDSAFSATANFPIGHRFLNIGNTAITGTDLNGKSFENAVVEVVLDNSADISGTAYEVKYKPGSTTDRMQVVSIMDNEVWEWDQSVSQWKDVTTEGGFRNDDCFHQYFSIQNVKGVDPKPHETDNTNFPEITSDGSKFNNNINSAIEIIYKFSAIDSLPTGADQHKKGGWLSFAFPFPISKFNSIGEGVGDIYGGGDNETEITKPYVLDTQNMTASHNNKFGFNNGTDSEDLGPLQALSFMMRIGIEDAAQNTLDGVAVVRCTMYDIKDNVVTQDFEINFTDGNTWQPVELPFSGFNIYRGREPFTRAERALSITGFVLPIKELDVQDIFEYRNIKLVTFQIQNFYDENGRYNPEKDFLDFSNTGFQTNAGGTIRLAVDAFHFTKPLLVSSGADTTQNIEPVFLQHPEVISYKQLKNLAFSELEIQETPLKEYNFQTSGDNIFDIRFGDTFFLENSDLISDTDDTTMGETTKKKIRLVAKRIEYHLSKPSVGPGGLTRTIKGVKRISV